MGLRRVLDDRGAMPGGVLGQLLHRGQLAEQVHGQDRGGSRAYHCGGRHGIEQEVIRINFGEDRPGTGPDDRCRTGHERVRGYDYFCIWWYVRSPQGQLNSVGAASHSDAVRRAGEGGELALELDHLGTFDERPIGHDAMDSAADLVGHLAVRRLEVDQRYDVRLARQDVPP